MPTSVKEIRLDSGSTVLVEVHDRNYQEQPRRAGVPETVAKTFESAWGAVLPVINSLTKSVSSFGVQEAEIKFGVKLGSNLDAFIASATAEANFEVTLVYKSPGSK